MRYVTFFTLICVLFTFQFLPAQDPFPGTALEFDGVDDYVQADTVVIPSSGNFTVSLWAKANSIPPGFVEMLSQNAGSGEDFYIGKTSTGNVRAGDNWHDTGVPFPTDGLWHYYTVVKETLNTHLYIDGFHRASKNGSIVNPAGSEFRIARQYGIHAEYFPGLIEEVRIWNTARTTQEIRENMHLTLTGSESGLVCYWQFNEAAGDTTYDPVAGYYGTLFNMDSTDWTPSPVPVAGGSSFTQIVSSPGIFDFSGTGLSMDFTAKTGVDTIVVSRLDLAPNITPLSPISFNSQYWLVNIFGSGTFTADLTFTPSEVITPEDETTPDALRLLNRASNSTGNWSNPVAAVSASASNNTVTFEGISTFSQFLIGRQWFTDINAGLPGAAVSSVAWGDYDNDGDLDILINGNTSSGGISSIYHNDAGIFTDINAGLAGGGDGSVALGDYDNDGDLDILLTCYTSLDSISRIYRNDTGIFTDINAGLPGVQGGSVAWGDYDNDGDLDILLTGLRASAGVTKIYRNDYGIFTDIAAGLPGIKDGSVAWGDYDNDGDLDILLTGLLVSSTISRIYRNDAGVFSDINAGLTGVRYSSVAWGDYDNDGDLDILLTGEGFTMWSNTSRIYRNDAGVFSDINAGLTGITLGSAAWGDYDNDGDLDILLTGMDSTFTLCISRIYRNDSGVFSDINAGLHGVFWSSAAWGDYDNDGDLDILLTGQTWSSSISKIYSCNYSVPNSPPLLPGGLTSVVYTDSIAFTWNKASDNETPRDGLSYNMFIGNSEYDTLLISPMADIHSGYRYIPVFGNACQVTSWSYKGMVEYFFFPQVRTPDYWGVQAIDHAFAGSPFAIDSLYFPIIYLPTINNNIMQLTDTLAWEIQFGDSITAYHIQIDEDSTFTSCEVNDTLFGPISGTGYYSIHLQYLYGSHNLVTGTQYYWRVKPTYTFGSPTVFTQPAPSFWFGFVSKIAEEKEIPKHFSLYQNYPNPFNPSTAIEFDLPKISEVTLRVFNILGEEVGTLVSDKLSAGSYSRAWDASNLSSGVYLYRLEAGDYIETRKLILMK
jgi:predicted nucleotidyltransferase